MALTEQALVERNGGTTELTTAASAEELRRRLQEMRQKVSIVQAFFRDVMVENEDYGIIPGTQKPTLLKAGAEKLCEFYGYSIHVEVEREEKDRLTGYYECSVKVTLVSRRTGEIVAEGVGSASTMESRYRWRWVFASDLPSDVDKSTLKTRKVRTKNGEATQYRLENDDPWSLWNTVLKMAKKRALIDATLSATRSSGIFTQDVEDLREWAAQGEVIDAEFTPVGEDEPKRASKPKSSQNGNGTPKAADESKRDDYHAAILAYLTEAHGVTAAEYPAFIAHAIGGDVRDCDIHRLANLARRAYVARHRGDAAAKEHIAGIVDEFMASLVRDDEPPQDTAEHQALV